MVIEAIRTKLSKWRWDDTWELFGFAAVNYFEAMTSRKSVYEKVGEYDMGDWQAVFRDHAINLYEGRKNTTSHSYMNHSFFIKSEELAIELGRYMHFFELDKTPELDKHVMFDIIRK